MAQETTVKERLISYIRYKGISQGSFEKQCGLSNGYINNISKGIGAEKLQSILSNFPDLNTAWLVTGEGEMLRSNSQSGNNSSHFNGNGNTNQVNSSETLNKAIDEIAAQRKLVSKSQEQLSKSQEQIDRLLAIIEKITK